MKQIFIIVIAFLSQFSFAQDNLRLKLYRENEDKTNFIYADNEEFAPVSLEFSYTATNISSSLSNKSVVIIPANSKKFLITTLNSIDPKKGTSFKYDVFYVFGDVHAKNTESSITYSLPFAKNKKYLVYQGYNGNFSHQNSYSIDFSLQTGDEVYAARDGKVVQVVIKNNQNCTTKNCTTYNNKIIILHNDGTFAEYVHLKENGSVVKIGDEISQGQLIGYSGNTGWSKGPHLHFSVFTNKIDGERNYIKTKFKTDSSQKPIYLEEKKQYSRSL